MGFQFTDFIISFQIAKSKTCPIIFIDFTSTQMVFNPTIISSFMPASVSGRKPCYSMRGCLFPACYSLSGKNN